MRYLVALVLSLVGCSETSGALPIELCDGSDEIRYVGRFALSDGPPYPGSPFFAGAYGGRFAAIDGGCRFWVLDVFDAPGVLRSGTLNEVTAAAIEEELFGFNQLIGTHSDPNSSFDAVIALYTPDGIAIRPNASEEGSIEAAVEIERLHWQVHQRLWERGTRSDGPVEYTLTPELDEDLLRDCFDDAAVAWTLEGSIESFVTGEGETGEVEAAAASDLRDLADTHREEYGGAANDSPCGAVVPVTGPDDAPYRLILRDAAPSEVGLAAAKLPSVP